MVFSLNTCLLLSKTGLNGCTANLAAMDNGHLPPAGGKQTRNAAVAKKADRTAYDVRFICSSELPKIPRLK